MAAKVSDEAAVKSAQDTEKTAKEAKKAVK